MKSGKYYIFCISTIKSLKSLQKFNQVIVIMEENMIVIRDPKTFSFDFDWPKSVDENLKHETELIIKNNESLTENEIKTRLNNYCPIITMETIFMNTENSKTNEPHKFVLNLSKRLDLRSSNKYVALQNLSTYYTLKNIRKQYKNNKLKIIAPTRNDEFELPDGFILCQIFKVPWNISLKSMKP